MDDELLTLAELAERSGVEVRTLRSWIQQGLLPGPDSVGRNARYAPSALSRVRAVKAMRDVYGLSLSAIRQDLLAADEERIASFAALAAPVGSPLTSVTASQAAPAGSSASDYLRGLRRTGVYGASGGP